MHPAARVLSAAAVIALLVAASWVVRSREPVARALGLQVARSAPAVPSASPGILIDPLVPDRPVSFDRAPRTEASDWVNARPGFQYSRLAAERGGVSPCATQKVDVSGFEDWVPLSQGHFVVAKDFALDGSGRFDLVIHLHGDEPVRRELVESGQRFVLYTLTLPPNESYGPLFSGSQLFETIAAEVAQALSKRAGRPASVGRVALSAWSAGFIGVEAILAQPTSADVNAVILIDGLHAPRGDRSAFVAQLEPFAHYAARAAAGNVFMVVSHSSIDPPDFASTTECAHYLINAQGGKPVAVRRNDALGLELVEYFSRGNFHVRGYAGNDKADHCAQLGVLRGAFAALGRHWAR